MQFQAQVGRQNKPAGNLLFFALGGHGLGQAAQNAFPETAIKEVSLVGLADGFEMVELSPSESLQHFLRLIFDKAQIHGGEPQAARPLAGPG